MLHGCKRPKTNKQKQCIHIYTHISCFSYTCHKFVPHLEPAHDSGATVILFGLFICVAIGTTKIKFLNRTDVYKFVCMKKKIFKDYSINSPFKRKKKMPLTHTNS